MCFITSNHVPWVWQRRENLCLQVSEVKGAHGWKLRWALRVYATGGEMLLPLGAPRQLWLLGPRGSSGLVLTLYSSLWTQCLSSLKTHILKPYSPL